jgi:indole-3-glycerol phosphate synthase
VSEQVKINLIQLIVSRLEDEVVKELVDALYHYAMTRLNPDDVTVCHYILHL